MTTLATAPMGSTCTTNVSSTGQIGVNGFFYHFLDSRTGTRMVQTNEMGEVVNGSELSTIDTAICAFGVIACRQAMTVTNGYTTQQASQITSLADTILGRIDWPFLLQTHGDKQMYLGWKPESSYDYTMLHPSGVGYVSSTYDREYTCDTSTDEALLIAVAGMASPNPTKRLPATFMSSWQRVKATFAGYDVVMSHNGSAFTYQFANLWLPLDQMSPDSSGHGLVAECVLCGPLQLCLLHEPGGTRRLLDVRRKVLRSHGVRRSVRSLSRLRLRPSGRNHESDHPMPR